MTAWQIDFDDATVEWLIQLAELTNTPVRRIVSSMIKEIRLDDQRHHDAVIPAAPNHHLH